MPSTLNEIYSRSLEKIPEIQRKRAMRLLSLLAHSSRPLSEREAKHALAICIGTDICWGSELDWRAIKRITLSLTAETTVETFGAHSRAIQLAHSSVRDFLLSQSKCSFWGLTESKICTAEICLSYLLQVSKDSRQTINLAKHQTEAPRILLRKYPFSGWAARHWMKPARPQEVQHAILPQLMHLFHGKNPFWFWKAIIRAEVPRNLTEPLDLASYFDLTMIVERLLNEGVTDHEMASAFAAVCAQGNWESAQILSRSNIMVPLHLLDFASSEGNLKLVRALTTGHNTFTPGLFDDLLGKTILSARGDYEKLAAYFILEKGARWRTLIDQGFMTASFRRLCLGKKTSLVKLLTENGLDFGPYAYKAIYIARHMRGHDIAELLFQTLIDSRKPPTIPYTRAASRPIPGGDPDRNISIFTDPGLGERRALCEPRYNSTHTPAPVRPPHEYGYSGTKWT